METQKTNAPKYAFFYLLSLVALGFTAISTGTVIFQYINRYVLDPLATYGSIFNTGALNFAISAIIIAGPVYFLLMWTMNKSLYKGELGKDSGIRKWLTYFILFVTSVVILGTLIGIISSYLGGDLTAQFVLKALTAIVISGVVFSYYFLEIRRDDVVGKTFKLNKLYFLGSMTFVTASLVAALVLVPSPTETRNQRFDNQLVSNFDQIYNVVNTYYNDNGKLPETLNTVLADNRYLGNITADTLKEPGTDNMIVYTIKRNDTFELCANFKTNNKDGATPKDIYIEPYYTSRWPHGVGYQCLEQTAKLYNATDNPVPVKR